MPGPSAVRSACTEAPTQVGLAWAFGRSVGLRRPGISASAKAEAWHRVPREGFLITPTQVGLTWAFGRSVGLHRSADSSRPCLGLRPFGRPAPKRRLKSALPGPSAIRSACAEAPTQVGLAWAFGRAVGLHRSAD
ncbi:MAG: hypothetical protein NZ769_03410 [Anaerolineae bacterium]|nr:hypothetical protein [Anaerolineae bacterium]